jgi:hypothetical protein
MTYHTHGISLSKPQIGKLSRGGAVRLKHSQLKGPHTVYLTSKQMNHLSKAHKGGHGAQISMSHDQLRHHAVNGGSIFDTLKRWGKKFLSAVAPYASDLALTAAHAAAPHLNDITNDISSRVSAGVTRGINNLGNRARAGVDRALSSVGTGVTDGDGIFSDALSSFGLGIKPKRARKVKVQGDGFLDDIWSGVKHVGAAALPVAVGLAGKTLLGGKIKKRGRKARGAGLYA